MTRLKNCRNPRNHVLQNVVGVVVGSNLALTKQLQFKRDSLTDGGVGVIGQSRKEVIVQAGRRFRTRALKNKGL